VIAYALAGSMDVDLNDDPLGQDADGDDVFLRDIWPSPQEVQRVIDEAVSAEHVRPQLRRRLRRHRAVAEPAHADR
jgi:aconitase A